VVGGGSDVVMFSGDPQKQDLCIVCENKVDDIMDNMDM